MNNHDHADCRTCTAERTAPCVKESLPTGATDMCKILDNLPTAIACMEQGPDPKILFLNKQFVRTFGYTLSEIPTVAAWASLAYPDEEYRAEIVPPWFAALEQAVREQSSVPSAEYRITCKDGSIRVALISADILDNLFLVSLVDITDQKEALEKVQKIEARYARAFRGTKHGLWELDLRTRVDYHSPLYEELLGYETNELDHSLDAFFSIVHPDDRTKVQAAQQAYLLRNEPYDLEMRLRTRSGEYRWFRSRGQAERDEGGKVLTIAGTITDITPRKQAETALRASEERYRLFAENVKDVIWTMGPDGGFTYISPSAEKQSGYTVAEALKLPLHKMLTPQSLAIASDYLTKSFASGQAGLPIEIFHHELEQIRKDGSTVWVDVTSSGMYDVNGVFLGMLGVNRDISERKEYERELELAREAAESASRAKSAFLANMSHEIRTPMNAVLGLTQLLEKEPLLFPDQRDMVRRISTAGRSLLSILNDILDFSKIEAGQVRIEPRPLSLMPLLQHLEVLQGNAAREKGLIFSIEPVSEPGGLLGDSLRLEQILLNLISNAVKFTDQGEIRIRAIPVELSAVTARFRFEVIDTGVGIAPDVLETLFKPFTQADETITRRFGGTGLGLSIARRLVELMGGTVGIESSVGVGSTFWFEIPFERTDTVTGPADVPCVIPTGPRLRGMRVLMVDDSDINRDLISRALSREGAEVSLANDGQHALDTLRSASPMFDAVLMDIQMPIMDGLTATRHIRSELGLTELPVIAFTAGVLHQERQKSLDAGASDFLPKPVDLEELCGLLLSRKKTIPGSAGACRDERPAEKTPPPVAPVPPQPPPADSGQGIPEIPGIDTRRAAFTFGNDRKFFLELFGAFLSRFGDTAERVGAALAQGDPAAATRLLHTVRGTAGNLGATDLMQCAGELEQAIKNGAPDPAPVLIRFTGKLAALVKDGAPWLRKPGASPTAPAVTAPPDPAKLEQLKNALTNHDMMSLNLFEELEGALAGFCGEQETQAMAEALRELRFEEALHILQDHAV